MSTPSNFFGRENELVWLRSHFGAVATRADDGEYPGPRMAVILAETGHGKSRLVQELFRRLSTDDAWDPPSNKYWPEAFLDVRAQARVNPDMSGHVPAGPPRFLWLAVRWQPTDQRKGDRRSALPDLRHELGVHAGIIERHQEIMRSVLARSARAAKTDGGEEPTADAVGALLPFGGFVSTASPESSEEPSDRRSNLKAQDDTGDEQVREIADDLLACFEALLQGAHAIPAILWLDDAQWIDPETQQFVTRLWDQAHHRRWPLLIVVTHWEREWRRLARKRADDRLATLAAFEGRDGVSLHHLADASDPDLRACLQSRLPGLTTAQEDLLVAKADGNFLTMIENIGDLRSEARNFVDGDARGPLSRKGEAFATTWETERSKRVEQRFMALAPQVKDLLGWSSHLGVRFLHSVVTDFAMRVAKQADAASDFEWCVDLGVVLGAPSRLTREFRDKAFHVVAARHFSIHGKPYEAALTAALREHLVRWIAASFDAEGGLVQLPEEGDLAALLDQDSASAMLLTGQHAELRDLLDMARHELPRPERPDWNDPVAATWLRVLRLAAHNDAAENLWDRVRDVGRELESVRWEDVPMTVLGEVGRDRLAERLETSGAVKATTRMRRAELARNRARVREEPTQDARREVSLSLRRNGILAEAQGDMNSARVCYAEALEIDRALLEEMGTVDEHRAVAISIVDLADILLDQDDLAAALTQYEEALAIFVELDEDLKTAESSRDVSKLLYRLGRVALGQDDLEKAKRLHTESLEIDRRLAEEFDEAADRRDVFISLESLADIAQREGDLGTARALVAEALAMARALCLDVGTPQSQRDVMTLAVTLGELAETHGDMEASTMHGAEALEMARALNARHGTLDTRRLVARCVEAVGRTAGMQGDLERSYACYAEVLAIERSLAQELGTPESRHDLAVSLHDLSEIAGARGDIEAARGLVAEALTVARGVEEPAPETRNVLLILLGSAAELAMGVGDFEHARACYVEAVERNRRECREAPTLEATNRHVWAAVCLSRCLLETKELDEVLPLLAPFRSEVDQLAKADQEREYVDTAAAYWEAMAAAAVGLGREDEAGVAHELAAPLRARVVELDG